MTFDQDAIDSLERRVRESLKTADKKTKDLFEKLDELKARDADKIQKKSEEKRKESENDFDF